MMKSAISIERRLRRNRSQQGDALFEALIGFMLLMVLGLGLSYAAARAMNSQRYASTQNIALNQMRDWLHKDPTADGGGVQALCDKAATKDISITPVGGTALNIPVTASNCLKNDVTVGVATDATLSVTLKGTNANSVYTRMSLGTAADNDNARSLLGNGSTVLSQ